MKFFFQGLEQLVKKFKSNGQKLILYNASLEVMSRLQGAEWADVRQLQAATECDAVCVSVDNALCAPRTDDDTKDPLLQHTQSENTEEN